MDVLIFIGAAIVLFSLAVLIYKKGKQDERKDIELGAAKDIEHHYEVMAENLNKVDSLVDRVKNRLSRKPSRMRNNDKN